MSKRQWLMILGASTIIIPLLGFPSSWDTIILSVLGVLIISISYCLEPGYTKTDEPKSLPFSEHQSPKPPPDSSQQDKNITSTPSLLGQ